LDKKLIAAIYKDRRAYDKIAKYIDKSPEDVLSDLNVILYEQARQYYDNDPEAQTVDVDVIKSMASRSYPKQEAMLSKAVERLMETDVPSSTNIVKEFIEAKKYAVGLKLSTALVNGGQVAELLDEYETLHGEEALESDKGVAVYVAPKMSDIAEEVSVRNLIKVYPEELNQRLGGGLLRGHHLLVFARPEVGKSMVAINMARGFIEQGLRVLYAGNEDPSASMMTRMFSSLLDKSKQELLELPPEDVDDMLESAGSSLFTFAMLDPGSPWEIRGLVERHKPDVVIVDQLRNLKCSSDGMVQRLETAAMELRNIAQRCHVLMVSVTQAGDSATDKLVLAMSDVDSSKTGIPAQVDVMVGVGMDAEYQSRGKRMFSLPKNKPGNDHSFFSVSVNEATSRVY
jgi:archaellum biogenesis ATPase FlaH